MRIKEQDSEHLIISNTWWERIVALFWVVVGVSLISLFFSVFSSSVFENMDFMVIPFILVPLVPIYRGIRILIGKRFTFDKLRNTVVVSKPNVFLVREGYTLSFADIDNVDITYQEIRGEHSSTDAWKVTLNIGGHVIEVDNGKNKHKMYQLANEIHNFTGALLADRSAKPEGIFGRLFSWFR